MIKKFLLLTTVLLAGLAANAATDYGFDVAGTTVTSDNCNNITNSYITSGKVYYDPSNNTLFVNDATIICTGSNKRAINNTGNTDLVVMFHGTCLLSSQDAAAVRLCKSTALWAPQEGTTVNIRGVNEEGIYLINNSTEAYFQGPGKFNIFSNKKPAIAGKVSTSTDAPTELADLYRVTFEGVKAELSCTNNNVVRRVDMYFKGGSSVRFKATNNSDYSVITRARMYLSDNVALLEPYGARISNSATPHDGPTGTVYDANGNRIYDKDIYFSDDYVAILNESYFPDVNFRNYLLSVYTKGYLTQSDVNARKSMIVSNMNIRTLSGLKYFSELTSLNCNNNTMGEFCLDLRFNTKLKSVTCSGSNLKQILLWGLTNLETLDCHNNSLNDTGSLIPLLDLRTCTNLEELECSNNQLTSLDVSNMKALRNVWCNGNNLTSINVNGCSALIYLDCAQNKFTALTINNLSNLKTLYCGSNTSLTTLTCPSNNLTTLDVTGNTALTKLQCPNNKNLATIIGLANCNAMTYLDCDNCALTDLSAVSGMNNLTNLYVSKNKLTNLNVAGKTKLAYLGATNNPQLTKLYCYNCALTYFDISNNTALTDLRCFANHNLATIGGLASCTAMKTLYCYGCSLTDLSAANSLNNLEILSCSDNMITELTVTNKSKLTYLACDMNSKLATLVVTGNPALTQLDASYCSALTSLQCYDNALTTLNVTGNTALKIFSCTNNNLSSLSFSGCNALNSVWCNKNKIAGANMTNMVNSLPMRSESNPGTLRVLNNTGENNVITEEQLNVARNKYWNPKRWNGHNWEDITSSSEGLLGDFDNSKVIDVEDVNAAINIILKIKTMADYPGNGDMDNNGFIDVEDVNAIINIILKQ